VRTAAEDLQVMSFVPETAISERQAKRLSLTLRFGVPKNPARCDPSQYRIISELTQMI